MKNQLGMTLLELVIAISLLAFISIFIAQSTKQATATRKSMQLGLDQASALRNAVRVIERDISLAFHYRDPNIELENAVERKKNADQQKQGLAAQTGEGPKLREVPNLTHFQGEKNKLAFTSLAGVRMQPDAKESEQREISYEMRSCRSIEEPDKGTNCIFRKTSPEIDENLSEGGESQLLLSNVTKFELRYYGEGKDDWNPVWKSGEGFDGVTQNKFPQAVEITIETDHRGKKMILSSVAQLRFPNNEQKSTGEMSEQGGTSR